MRQFELATAALQHLQQSLGGLKEIRILGRGALLRRSVRRAGAAAAALESRRVTLEALPRLLLENGVRRGHARARRGRDARPDAASVLPLVSLLRVVGFSAIPAAQRLALQVDAARWRLLRATSLVADLDCSSRARSTDGPRRRTARDARSVARSHSSTSRAGTRAARCQLCRAPRRVSRDRRGHGRGQEHADRHPDRARCPRPAAACWSTAAAIDAKVDGWQRNIGYVPQSPFLLDDTLRRNIALGVADERIDDAALARASRSRSSTSLRARAARRAGHRGRRARDPAVREASGSAWRSRGRSTAIPR